jgi:hypothetical protein
LTELRWREAARQIETRNVPKKSRRAEGIKPRMNANERQSKSMKGVRLIDAFCSKEIRIFRSEFASIGVHSRFLRTQEMNLRVLSTCLPS